MKETKDSVKRFLRANGMYHEDIGMEECCDVFTDEMKKGLSGKDSSLAMIPTYIEADREIPADRRVIALDAGGTSFRAAAIHFDTSGKCVIEKLVQRSMPGLESLIERAAKLVAAMLSSVVLKTGKGCDPSVPVCITADGTTFYELKGLKERTEHYLSEFLEKKHARFIEFVNVDNAPLIGAAIAGLTN